MSDEHPIEPTPLPHLNRATLERLDERTAAIQEDITELRKELSTTYATRESVANLSDRIDKCVSKDEFEPVKKIVYGMVGLILLTVLGAAIAAVVIIP